MIEKEFVECYRFYKIYKITDAKGQTLFNACHARPDKHGITHAGSTLEEVKQSIDRMYAFCEKNKLNIRG